MDGSLLSGRLRRREIPAAPGGRHDALRATLAALRDEQRRLERLGLELPLARCHEELRYFGFVAALLDPRVAAADPATEGGTAWPGERA